MPPSLSPSPFPHGKKKKTQLPLFKRRWKLLLALASWQYFHGAQSQLAHRLHTRPLPQPLRDAGFALLPELGPGPREWAS